jgi:hypothetical protein
LGELRTAAHESRCGPADFRAVVVEPDALGNHFHILLLQAGGAAMFAFLGTTDTGVDARLKILMRHEFSPLRQVTRRGTTKSQRREPPKSSQIMFQSLMPAHYLN